jgi:hypothetical protein
MTIRKNDYAKGLKPMPIGDGAGDLQEIVLPISVTANPTANDIDVAGYIPEDHVPVDWFVTSDDMDSSTGIAFSVGVLLADLSDLDTTARGGGAAWATGVTVAQSGTLARNTGVATVATPPASADRKYVGVKWTAAATGTFTAGTLKLHLFYRPAAYGA